MIKEKKYKIVALTMFYVLTIVLFLWRIVWLFFYVPSQANLSPVVVLEPAVLKLAIGVVQIWICIELTVKLNLSTRLYDHENRSKFLGGDYR